MLGRLGRLTAKKGVFGRFKRCRENENECKRLHWGLGSWEVVNFYENAFINFSKIEYDYIEKQFYYITILIINFLIF